MARLAAFSLFPSFDTAPGGGGGAAVAPPAAPAAPAPSAAAPAAPAAAPAKAGIFGGVVTPKIELPPKPGAAPAAAPAKPGEPPVAAAKPGEPPAAQPPASFTVDTPFAEPLMGRYKTPKEAEEGLRRSQDEGLRLHEETKALKASVEKTKTEYEARVKALQAELEIARTTTPFKELAKEDLEKLRKEDPAAYADYRLAKDAHERDAQAKKDQIERQTQDRARIQSEILAEIRTREKEMLADTKNYPMYKEMRPVMEQFVDATKVGDYSPLTGHPWSGETLYLMSMGHAYVQALAAAGEAQTGAAAAAAGTAAAAAASTAAPGAPGGGGSPSGGGDKAKEADAAWRKSVLESAPRSVFSGVGARK